MQGQNGMRGQSVNLVQDRNDDNKSLQPKMERSKISNAITDAAHSSVYNTNYATSIIFLEHELIFCKRHYFFHHLDWEFYHV